MKFSFYQQAEVLIALIVIPFLLFVFFKADRTKTQNEQEVIFFPKYDPLCMMIFVTLSYLFTGR